MNKQTFLKAVKSKVEAANPIKASRDIGGAAVSKVKEVVGRQKLVDNLLVGTNKKERATKISPTIMSNKDYSKVVRTAKGLMKEGKMKQAREYIKGEDTKIKKEINIK